MVAPIRRSALTRITRNPYVAGKFLWVSVCGTIHVQARSLLRCHAHARWSHFRMVSSEPRLSADHSFSPSSSKDGCTEGRSMLTSTIMTSTLQ